jgi:mono/diheme cytochrome c family protein
MASRADLQSKDMTRTSAVAASPAPLAWALTVLGLAVAWLPGSASAAPPPAIPGAAAFTEKHCAGCHNDIDKEGGLDLTTLAFTPDDPANSQRWVLVHDRVLAGEMPPKEKKRPDRGELTTFVQGVATALTAHERTVTTRQGRATQRRLNRYEFENALRDLLQAPWLQVKGELPEDGETELFNKVGDVLDVSHVQMTRYLRLAQQAIRQVMGIELARLELPPTTTRKFYARDEGVWTRTFLRRIDGNPNPERMAFPVFGKGPAPEVRARTVPLTVGDSDPATRELEAVGWMRSNYHPFHTIWDNFRAPVSGRYRVRWSGYTIWVGPNGFSTGTVRDKDGNKTLVNREPTWYQPNGDDVSTGRRDEPITVYAQGPTDVRRIGEFDLTPDPQVFDLGPIWIAANEALVTDASRFFRNRPGSASNPLAQRDGAPAVAFRWMEIEGPLWDEAATAGYRLLFGDLPLEKRATGAAEVTVTALPDPSNRGAQGAGGYGRVVRTAEVPVQVVSKAPRADAERLLRAFMTRAYRRPVLESEVQRYLAVFDGEMKNGHDFTYAMIAGYSAVLCSPGFLFLEEEPGRLNDYALASRLAFFLTNSPPDDALRARAARGELRQPDVLRAETERLLQDPKAGRFVEAFLDYWLELRKHDSTTPSNTLYPDYYLDEALVEASLAESRLFFTELLQKNLPARNVIHSDFTYLNERLAEHYDVPGVQGAAMRRVTLPADSVRGGVMTQAIVLKVTANGTTTSPVIRGKWIADRILGLHISPPPSSVGAVDPDTRGAVTIRQQLDQHRADASCAACHIKIDPPGFALENFDVMGGWRTRYRGDAKDQLPEIGLGKNGWPFDFHYALPVDAAGQTPDGRPFNDVREFKRLILDDEAQIARNLAKHLTVFATAAPVRFSDRPQIERILQSTRSSGYGVRGLVHAIVQSELFQMK